MSLTDDDFKKLERLIDKKMDDRFRQKNLSGQYREVKADVRRSQNEIELEQDDARMGMERIMMDVLKTNTKGLEEVRKSIAPLAQQLADTESAAVIAGKNSIAANGNATDSKLAAKEGSKVRKQNRLILLLQPPVIIVILKIIEHFL